jgi:hypothetical protein
VRRKKELFLMKKHGPATGERTFALTTSAKKPLAYLLCELFAVIKRGRLLYGQRPPTICHLQRNTTAWAENPHEKYKYKSGHAFLPRPLLPSQSGSIIHDGSLSGCFLL